MTEDPESPRGRRSRLEDEVLEILYRSDRPPTAMDRFRARSRAVRRSLSNGGPRSIGNISASFDTGGWLVAVIALCVVAFIVRDMSPLVARLLAIASLALIILAIVNSLRHPRQGSLKQWRGRNINMQPPTRPLWLDRVIRGSKRPPRR